MITSYVRDRMGTPRAYLFILLDLTGLVAPAAAGTPSQDDASDENPKGGGQYVGGSQLEGSEEG